MTITELYDRYRGIVSYEEDSAGKVTQLFDRSFSINDELSPDVILGTVRSVNEACVIDDGGVKYIDESLRRVSMDVSMVVVLTDIEFDRNDNGEVDGDNALLYYKYIKDMNLLDGYLSDKCGWQMRVFNDFVEGERQNFLSANSLQHTAHIVLMNLSEQMSNALISIVDAIEGFDPSRLKDVGDLLVKMNDSVKEVEKLKTLR